MYDSVPRAEMPEQPSLEPIAICGMSCRLPGGTDSPSALWRMLVEKRNGQTPKVPSSRFNIDAHLHEDRDRPGSFDVAGGYFLDGNPHDFDPGFFNITPIEAQWLDPQQRRMLEVSYECIESAGLTLDQIAGSNTAVFVGSFTADYQQMSTLETDFRHSYAATGVDPGIISNRIGNVFDLNGPSFTLNSACSSSIYALHLACNALRAKDCEAAIVGGVNLILTVDQQMNTAKLGVLSPTSTCHTFDESADGYGRAEGAGALYVKRLSDALRDGNPIRGVIRGSAVNTNGKVEGMGITHPSGRGQERVVRLAYEKAGLDPRHTAYAELHGTGTPVGDPIEVRATSKAMNDTRSTQDPLLIGAIKPNIGHSEAASGIFAVMKAAMMTEAAVIPGVAFFNRLNPEILDKEWNVRVHADTAPWPENFTLRRASVSSFGYGGTNGHVIIESVDNIVPSYRHATRKSNSPESHSTGRPLLLCFSAHDKPTLSRNIQAIKSVASEYYPADLAHTLNLHRTRMAHRGFTIIREGQEEVSFGADELRTGIAYNSRGGVGFLFTGQGAQWAGMGRLAVSQFPSFRETIEKLDRVLDRLTPKPIFTIKSMLSEDADVNRINDAEVSQPLCTAIQIALVDLFAEWGITPAVSIGHSSGEIAAAYAAGLISAPEAMVAAFIRGRVVAETASAGSMLAVGLGAEEAAAWLPSDPKEICIACENSPGSVTLSGDAQAITDLARRLKDEDIFAAELKTGRAYHSPHMSAVGDVYDVVLPRQLATLTADDLAWRKPRSQMISSVTGEIVVGDSLSPSYWSTNLRERVLFDTAVQRMGSEKAFEGVTSVVEVGCHAALARAFKQAKLKNKTYISSMMRDKNDVDQLLGVAGSLFLAGYPVNLEAVNRDPSEGEEVSQAPSSRKLLVDLPPYQWNYEKTYWSEARMSRERRAQVFPRHDLLGTRVPGLSNSCRVWRNIIRSRDVPWLKDHRLGEEAVFPAAGYLSCAIEALRQVFETENRELHGVVIRDIDIKSALIIPEEDGVETVLCLHTTTDKDYNFTLESVVSGEWTLHCDGRISPDSSPLHSRDHPVDELALTQRVSGKRWYDAFHRVGFRYNNTFQRLLEARTDKSLYQAAGDIIVSSSSGRMSAESRYILHPSTIDACLQLVIISLHAGKHKDMPWGVVPTHIKEFALTLKTQSADGPGHAVAWTDRFEGRRFNTHTCLADSEGRTLMDIRDLTCTSYEAVVPPDAFLPVENPEPFSVVAWKPDVQALSSPTSELDMAQIAEFICHKQAVRTALIVGRPQTTTIRSILDSLPPTCTVTIGFVEEQEASRDLCGFEGQATSEIVSRAPSEWLADLGNAQFDLVIVDYPEVTDSDISSNLITFDDTDIVPLLNREGWAIGPKSYFSSTSCTALPFGQCIAFTKHESKPASGTINGVIILATESCSSTDTSTSLAESLTACGTTVETTVMADSVPVEGQCVIVDDRRGETLLSLTEHEFTGLKALLTSSTPLLWLTQGVHEGRCAEGGTAEGFLRVIRSEHPSAKVILLDVDCDETIENVARAVFARFESLTTENPISDFEFWLHQNTLHIPRLYPHTQEKGAADSDVQDRESSAASTRSDGFTPSSNSVDESASSVSSADFTPVAEEEKRCESLSESNNKPNDVVNPVTPLHPAVHPAVEESSSAKSPETEFALSSEGTYLLVGCLGGIGRSLTTWMMEHGARHFAFISRSGVSKPEAARVVSNIERLKDASTRVYRADASDDMAMQCIAYSLQAERPIKGVVHAAMVLRDGMFEQMTHEAFKAAITPKVRGALSLHKALGSAELGFFVMTSSVSAVLGNTGQSNYSAANSFLDALAVQRRASGLAGTSLALPMVLDVGVVAEDEAIETSLTRKGLYGISEEEMLRGFRLAMEPSSPAHVVMGVEPRELATAVASNGTAPSVSQYAWMDNPLFSHVRASVEAEVARRSAGSGGNSGSVGNQEKGFTAALEAARASEQQQDAVLKVIAAHIAHRMSGILMIPEEDFELDGRSLASYGLDSMVGTEMRTWLFKEFGLDYSFQKLLASTLTFTVLAGVVAEKMGIFEKVGA